MRGDTSSNTQEELHRLYANTIPLSVSNDFDVYMRILIALESGRVPKTNALWLLRDDWASE